MDDDTRRLDVPMPDGLVLRRAARDTLRSDLAPLVTAFSDPWTDEEWAARSPAFVVERIVTAFDGEEPVACAGAEGFMLTVPGGEVAAGGLTLVGVLPTHRRRGILRAIIRQQLDAYRARGEAVSILWASEGAIYQRFGYGLATIRSAFEVDRSRVAFLRPADPIGRMRLVTLDEAHRLFPPIYDAVRVVTPGALTRDASMWRLGVLYDSASAAGEAGPKYLAVHETAGVPDGYAIYRVKPGWEPRGPKGALSVREVVGTSPAIESAIWRWVLDIDLVAKVTGDMLPTPPALLLALAEPRRLGVTLSDGLWLRLLDLPAALMARRYAMPGRLVLRVADAFCPWNAGTWSLEVDGPRDGTAWHQARVAPAGTGDVPDLDLDVADLGAAYLGGTRFEDLRAADRVRELVPGAVRRADRMFAADRTPSCSTMF